MSAFVPIVGIPCQPHGAMSSSGLRGGLRGGFRSAGARRSRLGRQTRCCAVPDDSGLETEVRSLLQSPEKAKQQRGLLLVRELPPAIALELLVLSVETSNNEWIRGMATVALGQLNVTDTATRLRAIQCLLEILGNDSAYSVRAAAAAGCGYLASSPYPEIAQVVEHLIRGCYEDHEWQVQFSCVVSLGNLGDRRAIPALHLALKSENGLIVQGAVGAIGEIADPDSIAPLLECLASDDQITRQRLAQALGSFALDHKEPAIIDALRLLAVDPSYLVREAAQISLQHYGCAEPQPDNSQLGKELLGSEVGQVESVDGLGKSSKELQARTTATDTMRRRLENSFEKESAMSGEGSFLTGPGSRNDTAAQFTGAESLPSEPIPRTNMFPLRGSDEDEDGNDLAHNKVEFDRLVDVLRNGNLIARSLALVGLRNMPAKLAWEAVMETNVMEDPSERIRSMALPLLARVKDISSLEALASGDADQSVRAGACGGLAEAGGGPAAVKVCLKAFETDSHWLVRINAAISLGTIGTGHQDVEDVLLNSLAPGGVKGLMPPEDNVIRRYAVGALGTLGALRALPAFKEMVASPTCDEALRFSVAGSVKDIPSAASAAIARMLVSDESSPVRELAKESLNALEALGFT
jgi:HEAT repeat protein